MHTGLKNKRYSPHWGAFGPHQGPFGPLVGGMKGYRTLMGDHMDPATGEAGGELCCYTFKNIAKGKNTEAYMCYPLQHTTPSGVFLPGR